MTCNVVISRAYKQEKASKAVTPVKIVLDLIGERESPSAAGLIFLDSRFHGNDNNGGFLTFYETIKADWTSVYNNLDAQIKIRHYSQTN